MSDLFAVRTIKSTDFERYANLSNFAFGVPVEGEREILNNHASSEQIFVSEVNQEIVAQLFIHRLGVWVNGVLFPLGGIGGVTTSQQHRKKGYATTLLQKTLEHMREKMNVVLSALYPVTYSLYYRNGWAVADRGSMFTAPSNSFNLLNPVSKQKTERRVLKIEDLDLLQNIRRRHAVTEQGFIERDELGWRIRIFEQFFENQQERQLVLHFDERSEADGYMIYSHKENNTVEALEFIHTSPESFDELLSFIPRQLPQTTVSIWLSSETPLLSKVVDPLGFIVTSDPSRQAMFRIVDVAKALTCRPVINTEINGTFTLQVIDPVARWNDGVWLIDVESGKIFCQRSKNSCTADAVLDIQTLTQLFVGYSTMNNTVANGLIQVNRPEALPLLKTFFESKSSPFSGEHF